MRKSGLMNALVLSSMFTVFISSGLASAGVHAESNAVSQRPCRSCELWKNTLANGQKAEIERIQLGFIKEINILEARLDIKRAEVRDLLLMDNPDTAAIDRKINEEMKLEKEIAHKEINHILAIRKILTPEQRISLDAEILSSGRALRGRHG